MQKAESLSAKMQVYNQLKDWIIEGKMKEGEKISDIEIAEKFHVSRTPVREALQLLETQKLVISGKGRGTEVAVIDKENIAKWYQPMMTLQQLAVTMALERAQKQDIEELKEMNENFRARIEEKADTLTVLEADKRFHDKIIEISDNEYVKDFCDILWIHIQRLEYSFFELSFSLEISVQEHEKLIHAIEIKDSFSASLVMKEHWNRTVLEIYSNMQERPQSAVEWS